MIEHCHTPEVAVVWTELKALRELIEVNRQADMRALALQAKEYERRLDELNHAHAEMKARNIEYLPRESHDLYMEQVTKRFESLNRLVYIGVGVVLTLQTAVTAFILLTRK